ISREACMKTTLFASSVVFSCAVVLMGCASDMKSSTSGYDEGRTSNRIAPVSLYERLGGKPAITAVVDDFVGRVAADNRINGKFANANIPRLKMLLVEQICQASGGPCTYAGRDMKTAHAGRGSNGSEFDALVGD